MAGKEDDPTQINSSYVVFFHSAVLFLAFAFAGTFNEWLYGFSLAINLLYGVGIFWFFYLLRQFHEENPILFFIIGFFSLSAVLGLASAVKGPLASGEVPVLGLSFINQQIVMWGAQTSFIYASVAISYGYLTYASSIFMAIAAEVLYNRVVRPILPGNLAKGLTRIDKDVDSASDRFAAHFFFMNQRRGVVATLIMLSAFAALYVALLWFG
jgi:hypothetical protein